VLETDAPSKAVIADARPNPEYVRATFRMREAAASDQ